MPEKNNIEESVSCHLKKENTNSRALFSAYTFFMQRRTFLLYNNHSSNFLYLCLNMKLKKYLALSLNHVC